ENSILRVSSTMATRLFYRFGGANGVLPAFPFNSSLYVAPIGRPEHTRIQDCRGYIIKDEGKREMVTNQFKAVDGLAAEQKQNAEEKDQREFQPNQDEQERNPWQAGFDLANRCPRRPANQAIEIFLPALPHGIEGPVHTHADDAFTGSKPDAMARRLDAHRNGYVFEHFARDAGMAADRAVNVAADHQELAVRCGGAGFR